METIGAYLLLFVMTVMVYGMYKVQEDRYKHRKQLSDEGVVMDEVQEESYNGKPLWIKEEERESWDKFSREMKRSIIREVEKKIKNGELYVHTDENGFTGLISVQEAKEKGYI